MHKENKVKVPSGVTYKITQLVWETVEFDGIRETIPISRDVAKIIGPATITVEYNES